MTERLSLHQFFGTKMIIFLKINQTLNLTIFLLLLFYRIIFYYSSIEECILPFDVIKYFFQSQIISNSFVPS